MRVRTIRPDLGDLPPDPARLPETIAVVLGGPMGVNDRHEPHMDWLQVELEWLSAWHQQQKPVLGICLGAQLLAVAAGGSVEPLEVGDPPHPLKELGIGAIHWLQESGDDPLLAGMTLAELDHEIELIRELSGMPGSISDGGHYDTHTAGLLEKHTARIE